MESLANCLLWVYEKMLVGSRADIWFFFLVAFRWEDNIKMDLQKVGGGCGDWLELAQDRDRWRALVGTVRNLRVPKMRGIS